MEALLAVAVFWIKTEFSDKGTHPLVNCVAKVKPIFIMVVIFM